MLRVVLTLGLALAPLAPLESQTVQRAAPHTTGYPIQYSSRLNLSSPSEIDQRLRAPFAEGIAHPAGMDNCAQMLAQCDPVAHGKCAGQASATSDRDFQAQKMTMVDCLILQQLRHAAPATSSYVEALQWDEHVVPLLPPQFAITVSKESALKAKSAAKGGKRWLDFDKTIAASADGPDQILVQGTGFEERLILWGRGDLNGDGLEDLLVQSLDALTQGTYRNTRLFLLTRKSPGGELSVVRTLF